MKLPKQIFSMIIVLLVALAAAMAQTPYFIHHDLIKGKRGYLSQVIFQDHEGFIWIGTSAGLILYDGVDYIQYTEEDGLAGTSVTAICEDSIGSLWIGHKNGKISRMLLGEFSKFMPEEGLGDIPVTDIKVDMQNRVWFSTQGEGVYYYSKDRLFNLNTDDGLADNYAYSIATHGETICIGTDYGISIYNSAQKTFDQISMKDGIPDNIIKKVLFDEQGNLWAGTDEAGLFSIRMDTREIALMPDWNFGSVSDFITDGEDFWISTEQHGVVQLIRNKDGIIRYKLITTGQGLLSNRCQSIFMDREMNLWIGTMDEVTQSVTSFFEFLDQRHGLPEDLMVYDFLIDKNNFYWVCSDKGLFKLTETSEGGFKIEKLFKGSRLEKFIFISLYEDLQSYIWAGTYDEGVIRINPADLSYTQYTTKDGLSDNNVISIIAKDESILFSTLGGGVSICNINEENIQFINLGTEYNEIEDYVYSSFIDSKQRIWFAQAGGRLTYLDNDRIFSFGEEDSLLISTIYSVLEDARHNIWFSTEDNGLYCYDGQGFINYNENNGLASSEILSIKNDPHGNLVIVSNEGIDILHSETKNIQRFGDNYGVAYKDPLLNSIYLHRNGDIWIGTGNGLIKYKPEALFTDTIQPLIFLGSWELYSEKIEPGKIRFTHKQNYFTFRYTGMWYQDPNRLRYRSMLEGYDTEWSSSTETRDRTYSKLPPGSYTFKVEVSLDNKVWFRSQRAEYSFTIRPPFWRTWWFISLSMVGILLSILAVFRIRLETLRKQKEELETEVIKATLEIRSQNEELESQNNEIQAQRDLVMEQRDQIYRQQEELQSSIRYALRIQTAVRTPMHIIEKLIPDCFILDKPRDIVSGDFYWVSEKEDHVFVAVADSTGHGVPGAFMSMLGVAGFNEILATSDCGLRSDSFLDYLQDHIKKALHNTGDATDAMDGMDVSLIVIDKSKNQLSFSGAFNPLYLIRNAELTEYKGDKMPIGWHTRDIGSFTETIIPLQEGDCLYLFSDGYADQFGGENGKKFMYKQFKKLLLDIHGMKMSKQSRILDQTIVDWQGTQEQVDDIMVIGIRI